MSEPEVIKNASTPVQPNRTPQAGLSSMCFFNKPTHAQNFAADEQPALALLGSRQAAGENIALI